MYIPEHFREDRDDVLWDAMARIGFANLVSGAFTVTPLPLLADRAGGVLLGHMARANPHWRELGDGVPAVALFQGPHHYVTPSWYPSKAEAGKAVPTWNYVAVHAHGVLRAVDDPARLRDLLERLTAVHEAGLKHPWAMSDAPEDYLAAMMKAVVAVELVVERLEGKWKLSQNRKPEDRDGVMRALAASDADVHQAALGEMGG